MPYSPPNDFRYLPNSHCFSRFSPKQMLLRRYLLTPLEFGTKVLVSSKTMDIFPECSLGYKCPSESLDHNRRLVKDLCSSHIPLGIYVDSCCLLDGLSVLFRGLGESLRESKIFIHIVPDMDAKKNLSAPCSVNKNQSDELFFCLFFCFGGF